MALVRIVSKGGTLDGSEVDNIASEETLLALLEQLKIINGNNTIIKKKSDKTISKTDKHFDTLGKIIGQNKSDTIRSIFNAVGGAGKSGEAGEASSMISKLIPELAELGIVITVLEIAKDVFYGLVNTSGMLAKSFMEGQSSFSDYTKAIAEGTKNIPIIGNLFGLFSQGIGIIDSWNNKLYEMNTIGAGFNNSLIAMRQSAAAAGMSLEEYSKIIMSNAANFALFGSVMAGVSVYNKVAAISMRDYTDQLTTMGISLSQYQSELPAILSLFGTSMKARGASDRELATSALILTGQFDAMSKITGQTREQQAADLQKMTADAAWQLKLTEMSTNEQLQQNAALSEIKSTMGDTAAELYKMKVLGIVPLNKEMQMLMATVPGLDKQFGEMTELAAKGKLTPEEMDKRVSTMISSGLNAGKGLEQILRAASSRIGGTPDIIAKIQTELMANKQAFYKNGVFNEQLFQQNLKNIRLEEERGEKIRNSLATWNTQMKVLQDYFYSKILIPIMNRLQPVIETIVKKFESKDGSIEVIIDSLVNIIYNVSSFVIGMVSMITNNWTLISTIFEVILGLAIVFAGAVAAVTVAAATLALVTAPVWVVVAALVGALIALVAIISWATFGKFTAPKMPTMPSMANTKMPSMPSTDSLENKENKSVSQPNTDVSTSLSKDKAVVVNSDNEQTKILAEIRDYMRDTAYNTNKSNRQFAAAQ